MVVRAVIVFSRSLTDNLGSNEIRLPPTHIGARRVRPSTLAARNAYRQHLQQKDQDHPVDAGNSNHIAKKRPRFSIEEDNLKVQENDEFDSDGKDMIGPHSNFNGSEEREKGEVPSATESPRVDASSTSGSSPNVIPREIVYKIKDENGVERRMTKAEKKLRKMQFRKEKHEAKKRIKQEKRENAAANTSTSSDKCDKLPSHPIVANSGTNRVSKKSSQPEKTNGNLKKSPSTTQTQGLNAADRRYYQLEVSEESLEEELAELKGERRVPPVVLSGPMVRQAIRLGALETCNLRKGKETSNTCSKEVILSPIEKNTIKELGEIKQKMKYEGDPSLSRVVVDNELAARWAALLKKGMQEPEDMRSKEPIRPMAYQLSPEVWSRLRPDPLSCSIQQSKQINCEKKPVADADINDNDQNSLQSSSTSCTNSIHPIEKNEPNTFSVDLSKGIQWSFTSTRRHITGLDEDLCTVFDQLCLLTNIHISCGAKFGCDFLLYDGIREKRHAFAGLRVIVNGISVGCNSVIVDDDTRVGENYALPIPSAYDLAGYVRGLNTAGKLALLATVVRSKKNDVARVVFVDLALEKILSAPTHQRKYKKDKYQKRKEVGKHLSKKKD